jgi:hypothetical protein
LSSCRGRRRRHGEGLVGVALQVHGVDVLGGTGDDLEDMVVDRGHDTVEPMPGGLGLCAVLPVGRYQAEVTDGPVDRLFTRAATAFGLGCCADATVQVQNGVLQALDVRVDGGRQWPGVGKVRCVG